MRSISTEPVLIAAFASRSAPIATMPRNMSLRLEAIVTSSTGNRISPSSTQ